MTDEVSGAFGTWVDDGGLPPPTLVTSLDPSLRHEARDPSSGDLAPVVDELGVDPGDP